eukprot:jgi/Mesvir1/26654/Mv20443-RA.1
MGGAKCVLQWVHDPGMSVTSQTFLDIVGALEAMGASRTGRWQATCALSRPAAMPKGDGGDGTGGHELYVVSFSHMPLQKFLLLQRHGSQLVVEGDAQLVAIMDNLDGYRHKMSVLWEGLVYTLGDFTLRVGRASLTTSEGLRGVTLEVEYLPVRDIQQSWPIMESFLNLWHQVADASELRGHFMVVQPHFGDYPDLPSDYSPSHAAVQYVNLCTSVLATRPTSSVV